MEFPIDHSARLVGVTFNVRASTDLGGFGLYQDISSLLVSFQNDPHVDWLLEESKNKFKLTILIDYVVHQTLRKGEIYLSDDNNAVAEMSIEREMRGAGSAFSTPTIVHFAVVLLLSAAMCALRRGLTPSRLSGVCWVWGALSTR